MSAEKEETGEQHGVSLASEPSFGSVHSHGVEEEEEEIEPSDSVLHRCCICLQNMEHNRSRQNTGTPDEKEEGEDVHFNFAVLNCCDHTFCIGCITKWKENSAAASTDGWTSYCPQCRAPIDLVAAHHSPLKGRARTEFFRSLSRKWKYEQQQQQQQEQELDQFTSDYSDDDGGSNSASFY